MSGGLDPFDEAINLDVESVLEDILTKLTANVVENSIPIQVKSSPKTNCSAYDDFDFDETNDLQGSKLTLVLKERSKRRCLIKSLQAMKRAKFDPGKSRSSDKVGYIYSISLLEQVNRIAKVKGRASMVHELIAAYGLLSLPNVIVISSQPVSKSHLLTFHTEEYINKLHSTEKTTDNTIATTNYDCDFDDSSLFDSSAANFEEFGLAYDCPAMNNMYTFVKEVAGSTLTALNALHLGHVSIAINWFGGWHHGKKDEASGFCYVNDIVIGILWLLKQGYRRVLYIDFDLHHGDAVEDAFAHTDKVFTLSFHKYETGFFPGTGSLHDRGYGKGKNYTLNIPLKDGIRDENYIKVATHALTKVLDFYKPQFIVSQFGADCITGDPMIGFSLTPKSLKVALSILMETKLPLLLLGGGGYEPTNVARTWTSLTGHAVNYDLDDNLPDNKHFLSYGPAFQLSIEEGTKRDQNSDHFLSTITSFIDTQLKKLD